MYVAAVLAPYKRAKVGKQVILTSHAEEFLHRIQQELGARRAADIRRYKFLPHDGEHELRVDSDPPVKNYVLLAQQALAGDEKREALRQARPALESLTDRLWSWLGRRGDGRIDIKLGGPRSPWELNNKCAKLKSAVERIAAQHAGAPEAVAALTRLLGVASGSIEWGYLNSGVHDAQRDHEFDRATVRTAYFGERDRRFRERDRFGWLGRCAVSIVDFLVSSGRVRAPGRWVWGMSF